MFYGLEYDCGAVHLWATSFSLSPSQMCAVRAEAIIRMFLVDSDMIINLAITGCLLIIAFQSSHGIELPLASSKCKHETPRITVGNFGPMFGPQQRKGKYYVQSGSCLNELQGRHYRTWHVSNVNRLRTFSFAPFRPHSHCQSS